MDEQEKNRNAAAEEQTRVIRNRDVITLSHVLYTIQDVCNTEQMRSWQQDRLFSMTQRITGMPGGGGNGQDMGDKMAVIGELEEKYARQCSEYLRALKRAEIILNSIENKKMQTFVVMRYVLNIGNAQIMTALNMKRRRFEQACRAVEQAPDMSHVVWPERFVMKG